jgi:hypothetical protein
MVCQEQNIYNILRLRYLVVIEGLGASEFTGLFFYKTERSGKERCANYFVNVSKIGISV